MYPAKSILITDPSMVGEARRYVTFLAKEMGFSEIEIANLAIIVTEAAGNLIKHATKLKELLIMPLQINTMTAIDIFALDQGPGIENMSACLIDGYSTTGTPGTGLGAIQRLSSEFDIYSSPSTGTVVWARMIKNFSQAQTLYEKQPTAEIVIGAICVPIQGETVSGDSWSERSIDSQYLLMLVDGLGHGPYAHDAASEAVNIFKHSSETSLTNILALQHKGLAKTRGAAVSIVKIDSQQEQVDFVGVGNVFGTIITQGVHRKMVTYNGIVGYQMRTAQVFSYPFSKDSILVLYSDGLISHWDDSKYPGILMKSPAIIAGLLYRDFNRGRDDTTVLVAAYPRSIRHENRN